MSNWSRAKALVGSLETYWPADRLCELAPRSRVVGHPQFNMSSNAFGCHPKMLFRVVAIPRNVS